MWQMEPTNGWQLSAQEFSEKHPNEMAHLLRNLHHYWAQLKVSKSHKSIEALYLHQEPSACISIDPRGMEDGMLDCRIYAFPDETRRILYLLCIGKASDRNSDLAYCKETVIYIVEQI